MKGTMGDMLEINSRTPMKKGKESELAMKSMEHERSANGAHVFTHRMMNNGGAYHEPEIHTFSADEGKQALSHFAEHAGLSEHMPAADKDSAAGAAT